MSEEEKTAMDLQLLLKKNSVLEMHLNQCINGNIELQSRLEILAERFEETSKELEELKNR